jgi:hypothetical protein
MEIFIDLAKIAEGQAGPTLPGIDLNLSGLVDFKEPDPTPGLTQNQLRTESELTLPNFNPAEYFGQIQAEFAKIAEAQQSSSIKDDIQTFLAAQQNSNTALDPLAAYLENRFTKIETITSNKDEIRELIQGLSDTRLTDIQSITSKVLKQTEPIEKTTSNSSINKAIDGLVDSLTSGGKNPEGPGMVILSDQKTKELVQQQQSNINTTSESISRLNDTISNFATEVINVINTSSESNINQVTQNLAEPKKGTLPMVNEAPKPDYGASSFNALRELVGGVSAISSPSPTNLAPQVNNTTNLVNPSQPQMNSSNMYQDEMSPNGPIMIGGGGGNDNSSVYLMQMLNFIKSGQLKVKIQ